MAEVDTNLTQQDSENIGRVLGYWFKRTPLKLTKRWFFPPREVDEEIRGNFEPLIEQARVGKLDAWATTPRGSLALIVLLDQFPRNIYRGSKLSYECDEKAWAIAKRSIANGFDLPPHVTEIQAVFFYMPLTHKEDLVSQIDALSHFERLATRCTESVSVTDTPERQEAIAFLKDSPAFVKAHHDVISSFGRFPRRNEVLGRESTVEEVKFLAKYPQGFIMPRNRE